MTPRMRVRTAAATTLSAVTLVAFMQALVDPLHASATISKVSKGGRMTGDLTGATRDSAGANLRSLDLSSEQVLWLQDKACEEKGGNGLKDVSGLSSETECAVRCHRQSGCVAFTWRGLGSVCSMYSSCTQVDEVLPTNGNAITGLFLYTDNKIMCHGDVQDSPIPGSAWRDGSTEAQVRCSHFCDLLRADDGKLLTKPEDVLSEDSWDSNDIFENKKMFRVGCGLPTARCACEGVLIVPADITAERGALTIDVQDTALKNLWRLETAFQIRLFDNYECANFGGTLQKTFDASKTASSCANLCEGHPDCVAFTLWYDSQTCVLKSVCNELEERLNSSGKRIGDAISGMFLLKNNNIVCHKFLHDQGGSFGGHMEGRNACRDWCEYSGGFVAGMGEDSLGNMRDQWTRKDVEQNTKSFGLSCGPGCTCGNVKAVAPSSNQRNFTALDRWGGWEMTGHLSHESEDLHGWSLASQKLEETVRSIYGRVCKESQEIISVNVSKTECMEHCHKQDGCVAFTYLQSGGKCDLLSYCSGLDPWSSEYAQHSTGLMMASGGNILCHNNTGDYFYKVPPVSSKNYPRYLSTTCKDWCSALKGNSGTAVERSSSWVQSMDTWNAYQITDNRRFYNFSCDQQRVCACQNIRYLHRA